MIISENPSETDVYSILILGAYLLNPQQITQDVKLHFTGAKAQNLSETPIKYGEALFDSYAPKKKDHKSLLNLALSLSHVIWMENLFMQIYAQVSLGFFILKCLDAINPATSHTAKTHHCISTQQPDYCYTLTKDHQCFPHWWSCCHLANAVCSINIAFADRIMLNCVIHFVLW